ncbi:sigma factor-like helix-turn-helix DNA-binding protein [Wukongibacter baidiensis]|uniref:RNA polymerase sigma factor n=1 Tax=Wukongibacter baidiensis TaxID=1723361 RepID=UPI003D7F8670
MGLYELIERVQQGDEEATISVFLRFHMAIKKLSKKLGYEEAETDMIIAFLQTIKEIDLNEICMKNDGGITNYIWLFLKHKSVDLFRKNISQRVETTDLHLDIIADDASCSVDDKLFVSMLLNSLPPLQRTVLKRKFIQGFSDNEIALLSGVSRQAVNRAKNRGLKNLRQRLDDMGVRGNWKKKFLN